MRTRSLPLLVLAMVLVYGTITAGCSEDTTSATTGGAATTATTATPGQAPATTQMPATTVTTSAPSTTEVPTTMEAPATTEAPPAGGPVETTVPTTSSPHTTEAQPTYETVGVQEAYQGLRTTEGAQIVDVREPSEWTETGVPPDAVLIPLGELQDRALDELKAERPVYVICRSGNRSRTGSEILVGLGFTQVYNVEGGIRAWMGAGLPVEAYEP
jgi:rhodanese-related sulfurtransferase